MYVCMSIYIYMYTGLTDGSIVVLSLIGSVNINQFIMGAFWFIAWTMQDKHDYLDVLLDPPKVSITLT